MRADNNPKESRNGSGFQLVVKATTKAYHVAQTPKVFVAYQYLQEVLCSSMALTKGCHKPTLLLFMVCVYQCAVLSGSFHDAEASHSFLLSNTLTDREVDSMQSASQSQLVVVGFIAEVSHDSKIVYNIFSIGLIERLTACIQPLSPSQLLNTNRFTASLVTVVDKWALVCLSGFIYQQ